MAKKPFKETKLGKFLQSKGFNTVLDAVGNVIPGVAVLDDVKDILMGNNPDIPAPSMSEEDKAYALELLKQEQAGLDSLLADVKDARGREVALIQAGNKNTTQNVLAYIGVSAFFAIVGYVIAIGIGEMTTEASFIVGNLTGISGAICKDIYGYYFGSSRSSAQKDATIQSMTRK